MSRYAMLLVGLVVVVGCDLKSPSPEAVRAAELRAREVEIAREVAVAEAAAAAAATDDATSPPRSGPGPARAPVASLGDPGDLALAPGYEMRPPVRDGRLTLIPIVATTPTPAAARTFLTLPEAAARGLVTITEKRAGEEEWDVETAVVRNRATVPLLVLNGEVLTEAHQDRVFAETTLVAAGARAELEVRCIEKGRAEGTSIFRAPGPIAALEIRRAAAHASQMDVWHEVDKINDRLGLSPETSTYRHAAQRQLAGANATRRVQLARRLDEHPARAQMVGVAVAIDDRVVAIDAFASPALYRTVEPRLLASYLQSSEGPAREVARLTAASVRALTPLASRTDASFTALRRPDGAAPGGPLSSDIGSN